MKNWKDAQIRFFFNFVFVSDRWRLWVINYLVRLLRGKRLCESAYKYGSKFADQTQARLLHTLYNNLWSPSKNSPNSSKMSKFTVRIWLSSEFVLSRYTQPYDSRISFDIFYNIVIWVCTSLSCILVLDRHFFAIFSQLIGFFFALKDTNARVFWTKNRLCPPCLYV